MKVKFLWKLTMATIVGGGAAISFVTPTELQVHAEEKGEDAAEQTGEEASPGEPVENNIDVVEIAVPVEGEAVPVADVAEQATDTVEPEVKEAEPVVAAEGVTTEAGEEIGDPVKEEEHTEVLEDQEEVADGAPKPIEEEPVQTVAEAADEEDEAADDEEVLEEATDETPVPPVPVEVEDKQSVEDTTKKVSQEEPQVVAAGTVTDEVSDEEEPKTPQNDTVIGVEDTKPSANSLISNKEEAELEIDDIEDHSATTEDEIKEEDLEVKLDTDSLVNAGLKPEFLLTNMAVVNGVEEQAQESEAVKPTYKVGDTYKLPDEFTNTYNFSSLRQISYADGLVVVQGRDTGSTVADKEAQMLYYVTQSDGTVYRLDKDLKITGIATDGQEQIMADASAAPITPGDTLTGLDFFDSDKVLINTHINVPNVNDPNKSYDYDYREAASDYTYCIGDYRIQEVYASADGYWFQMRNIKDVKDRDASEASSYNVRTTKDGRVLSVGTYRDTGFAVQPVPYISQNTGEEKEVQITKTASGEPRETTIKDALKERNYDLDNLKHKVEVPHFTAGVFADGTTYLRSEIVFANVYDCSEPFTMGTYPGVYESFLFPDGSVLNGRGGYVMETDASQRYKLGDEFLKDGQIEGLNKALQASPWVGNA